jgi:hypothetical protein
MDNSQIPERIAAARWEVTQVGALLLFAEDGSQVAAYGVGAWASVHRAPNSA